MKIWTITLKDTLIRFRDRNALLLMLAAPLVLSAIIGAAFGGLINNPTASPISDIPLVIVNDDEGTAGEEMLSVMSNEAELVELLEPTTMDDLEAARDEVRRGNSRAVVYIPAEFSAAMEGQGEHAQVQLYTDPTAVITPYIIRSVVTQLVNSFNTVGISVQVASEQISEHSDTLGPSMMGLGDVLRDEATRLGEEVGGTESLVRLDRVAIGGTEDQGNVNPLAFFAPSMAIFFLMFTALDGTRSVLEEEVEGTLPRLLSTTTTTTQILLGKIGGTLTSGLLQFAIFVLASQFLFSLTWGNSLLGLVLMAVVSVAAFTSLGAIIAAFAEDAGQASSLGGIVILISAILGGNFIPSSNFPSWLEPVSWLTINHWALDGLTELTINQKGVAEISTQLGILAGMAVVLFMLALWQFHRRLER